MDLETNSRDRRRDQCPGAPSHRDHHQASTGRANHRRPLSQIDLQSHGESHARELEKHNRQACKSSLSTNSPSGGIGPQIRAAKWRCTLVLHMLWLYQSETTLHRQPAQRLLATTFHAPLYRIWCHGTKSDHAYAFKAFVTIDKDRHFACYFCKELQRINERVR